MWKTVSDQYGKYSYVKVLSGNLKPDMQMVNARTGATGEAGPPVRHEGQEGRGGQGALLRRHRRHRQDGQGQDRRHPLRPPQGGQAGAHPFPEPCYSVAIAPKTKGQEDKIAAGLTRLDEEDLTFNWVNNAETHQMVVSGTGDMQMDVSGLPAEEPLRRGRRAQ